MTTVTLSFWNFGDLFSTTPTVPTTTVTDYETTEYYDYAYYSSLSCYNWSGFYWETDYGVSYTWDGLPVKSTVNDEVNAPIAGSMILFGIFGLLLNSYCARVIYKNSLVGWAVKYYLFIDCYCRFSEAWTELYKAYCVLTWECVSTDGFWLKGILINKIITSFNLGMIYSMQMLGNGLCFNRLFAVFFDGRFYSKIERIALPHGLILWAIPVAVYCYQIGDLVFEKDGFVCYGCWYFTPLEYCNTCLYRWDDTVTFFVDHFDHIMYGILGVTMVFDVLTLWRVRRLRKLSESKRRADIRLSIMLVTTHFITICFLFGNWVANNLVTTGMPIFYYLILEVSPFIVHSVLGSIVIIFNLPPKKRKDMNAATTTVTSVSVVAARNRTQIIHVKKH